MRALRRLPLLLVLALAGCSAVAASTRYRVEPQPRAGSCHPRGHGLFTLPDGHCTPGATDARVSQSTIHSTICRTGYTRTVRPPESITAREKRASMAAYGDR